MCAKSLQLCPTLCNLWTVAHQAPLSMGFCRQEYWSALPFASPGDLPNLGIEPESTALAADSLPLTHQGRKGNQKQKQKTSYRLKCGI